MAVKSASRVIDILELLGEAGGGMTHGEIARRLTLPKSSLTAVLRTMLERRFLEYDPATATYALGSALLTLSSVYLRRSDIPRLAQPIIAQLMIATGESAALTIPQDREVVVVGKENCDKAILYSLQLGGRGPIHGSASGKAILAMRPRAEVEALLGPGPLPRATPHTITEPRRLYAELDAIAAGEVAYSREEMVEGIVALGLPIFDAVGAPCAGISVGVPVVRFTAARERAIVAELRVAAHEISHRLGWQGGAIDNVSDMKRRAK